MTDHTESHGMWPHWTSVATGRDEKWDRWARKHYGVDNWERLSWEQLQPLLIEAGYVMGEPVRVADETGVVVYDYPGDGLAG